MPERQVELTEDFRNDVRRLLMSQGERGKSLAACQLANLIVNDGSYGEDAVFFGRMNGPGEGHGTEVFLFHWGEGFVGVGAMRVWYMLGDRGETVLGLCSDAEYPGHGSGYPEWPEMIRRAQDVFGNRSREGLRFD